MEKSIIFFDVDGTLVTGGPREQIPESAVRAIRSARQKGHLCYLCTGRSAAEIFSECGLPLQRAENDRVQGWYELREWLRLGEGGPRLRVCESCRNLIKSLSEIQRSVQDPNDAARTPHILTHAPDALRYFAAARPACPGEALAPREPVPMDSQIAGLLQYGR